MAIARRSIHWTSPFTTTSNVPAISNPVVSGDVLVIVAANQSADAAQTFSISGVTTTLRKALQDSTQTSFNNTTVWTANIAATATLSISCSSSNTSEFMAFGIATFSGVGAVGAVASAGGDSTGSLAITTGVAHACIVTVFNDFNGTGGTYTYRTTAGANTVDVNLVDSSAASLDVFHCLDAGAAGAKTVGISSPRTSWAEIAVELQPAAATAAPGSLIVNKALRRSTVY